MRLLGISLVLLHTYPSRVTLATLALVRTSLACVPQVSGLQARLRPILRGREMADAAWPGRHGHRRSPQERQMAEGQSVCATGTEPSSKARLFLPVLSLSEARVPV